MSEDSHAIVAMTSRHVSALTGQRAPSVRADLLGLVLKQSDALGDARRCVN
jgi:hypothetical protein